MNYLREDEQKVLEWNEEEMEGGRWPEIAYKRIKLLLARLAAARRTAMRFSLAFTVTFVFLVLWIILPLLASSEITAPVPVTTQIPPTTSLIPAITLRPTYPICIEPTGIPTPAPIRAEVLGDVWVLDGPGPDAKAITAAVPRGAEVTVIEHSTNRVHVTWEINSDTYLTGWIDAAWVKELPEE